MLRSHYLQISSESYTDFKFSTVLMFVLVNKIWKLSLNVYSECKSSSKIEWNFHTWKLF